MPLASPVICCSFFSSSTSSPANFLAALTSFFALLTLCIRNFIVFNSSSASFALLCSCARSTFSSASFIFNSSGESTIFGNKCLSSASISCRANAAVSILSLRILACFFNSSDSPLRLLCNLFCCAISPSISEQSTPICLASSHLVSASALACRIISFHL